MVLTFKITSYKLVPCSTLLDFLCFPETGILDTEVSRNWGSPFGRGPHNKRVLSKNDLRTCNTEYSNVGIIQCMSGNTHDEVEYEGERSRILQQRSFSALIRHKFHPSITPPYTRTREAHKGSSNLEASKLFMRLEECKGSYNPFINFYDRARICEQLNPKP